MIWSARTPTLSPIPPPSPLPLEECIVLVETDVTTETCTGMNGQRRYLATSTSHCMPCKIPLSEADSFNMWSAPYHILRIMIREGAATWCFWRALARRIPQIHPTRRWSVWRNDSKFDRQFLKKEQMVKHQGILVAGNVVDYWWEFVSCILLLLLAREVTQHNRLLWKHNSMPSPGLVAIETCRRRINHSVSLTTRVSVVRQMFALPEI